MTDYNKAQDTNHLSVPPPRVEVGMTNGWRLVLM